MHYLFFDYVIAMKTRRSVILSLRRISRETNASATIRDYLEILHKTLVPSIVQDDTIQRSG